MKNTLELLFESQKELDKFIIESKNIQITEKELMTDTLMALSVEVSELANEIRSFKHWSNKGASERGIILGEYVDVLHFFLSIGNQLGFTGAEVIDAYFCKNKINRERAVSGY